MVFFASRSRKSRSKPARRGSTWALAGYLFFYGLLALGVTYGIAATYQVLNSHPMFALDIIEIRGASSKTEADLRQSFASLLGSNFFSIDLAAIRSEAEKHPWVETADVYGHLPKSVEIAVVEAIPAGLIRDGSQVLVVASDGQVIAPMDQMDQLRAKKIDPVSFDALLNQPLMIGLPTGEERSQSIRQGLATLQTIRTTSFLFWEHMDTLDLSSQKNMIVQLRHEPAPLYLGPEVIPQNIRNYLTIAQYVQKEYPLLEYIELGFPNHIAIKPKEVK